MYNVTAEQQERISNASYVASYLAQKGFTVYSDMYEYSVNVDVNTDNIKEAWMLIEAMKGRTTLYKCREIRPHKSDEFKKWYCIRFKF